MMRGRSADQMQNTCSSSAASSWTCSRSRFSERYFFFHMPDLIRTSSGRRTPGFRRPLRRSCYPPSDGHPKKSPICWSPSSPSGAEAEICTLVNSREARRTAINELTWYQDRIPTGNPRLPDSPGWGCPFIHPASWSTHSGRFARPLRAGRLRPATSRRADRRIDPGKMSAFLLAGTLRWAAASLNRRRSLLVDEEVCATPSRGKMLGRLNLLSGRRA